MTAFAVTGLSAVTEYYYRVRFNRGGVMSDNSNTISVTTSDGTGVPANVQDAAPNNGDGNGDGIKGQPPDRCCLPSFGDTRQELSHRRSQ